MANVYDRSSRKFQCMTPMKPTRFLRFLSDNWPAVHALHASFGARTISETELIRVIRPHLSQQVLPHEKIKDMVDLAVLSEFKRGGRGYSINTQVLPIIEFLLNEQRLGLIAEIAINADQLKVHLADIESTLLASRRTAFFEKCQAMQDRFQNLNRMVESNTRAIYRMVDEAKQAGNSIPLIERYEKVIRAWDDYITPALQMKSLNQPFDQVMRLVRLSIQDWLADSTLHLLSTEDTRFELENVLYLMLDFRERLDQSIGIMSKHLTPLVHKARVSTQLAQGAALSFRDITHPESKLMRNRELKLPDKNRQVLKPDQDSLMAFYGELINYAGMPAATSVSVNTAVSSRKARDQRDNILQMLSWIKQQKPVSDIVRALMSQFPNARPSSVTKVLSKLSAEDKVRRLIKLNDDRQEYRFEHLMITMNRRSLELEPVTCRLAPLTHYTEVAFQ
jgi:hypothetical protein